MKDQSSRLFSFYFYFCWFSLYSECKFSAVNLISRLAMTFNFYLTFLKIGEFWHFCCEIWHFTSNSEIAEINFTSATMHKEWLWFALITWPITWLWRNMTSLDITSMLGCSLPISIFIQGRFVAIRWIKVKLKKIFFMKNRTFYKMSHIYESFLTSCFIYKS